MNIFIMIILISNILISYTYAQNNELSTQSDVYGTTNIDLNDTQSEFKFIKIASDRINFVALANDGTVWYVSSNKILRQIIGMDNIIDIGLFSGRTIGVCKDGSVWIMQEYDTKATRVQGISDAKSISESFIISNDNSSLYMLEDKMGESGTEDNLTYVVENTVGEKIEGINNIKKTISSQILNFIVKQDGTVWMWKNSVPPQNPNSKDENQLKASPDQIPGLTDVKDIVLGNASGKNYYERSANLSSTDSKFLNMDTVLALKNDGSIYVWLADYNIAPKDIVPKKSLELNNISSLCKTDNNVDGTQLYSIKTDGTLWRIQNQANGISVVQIQNVNNAKDCVDGQYFLLSVITCNGDILTVDKGNVHKIDGLNDISSICLFGQYGFMAIDNLGEISYKNIKDSTESILIRVYNAQVLVFKLGSSNIMVDDISYDIGASPVLVNNRTYVPLCAFSRLLNTEDISWYPEASTAIIKYFCRNTIQIEVDSPSKILINEKEFPLEDMIRIINNRIMIPLKSICKYLYLETSWNTKTQEITVTL